MVTQLSDDTLIDLIVETQDDKAVEELYKRYSTKIYRKCLSFVKEVSLAEDLTHDIFIKTLLNLAKFKKKSKFSTWIYSITYNYCIDFIRKNRKMNYVEITEEENKLETAEDDTHLIEIETGRMLELLNLLREDEKMILLMKYQDGMSIKEIQVSLGVSESAIKMRIKRAKEKMRVLYKKVYKEEA